MLCKNCGAELAEETKFCSACGVSMEAEATPAEEVSEAPVQECTEPKANPLQPLLDKVKPFVQKNKLILAGVGCVLLLIIAISIIASVCSGGNGFIATENAIWGTVSDDEVIVFWNNKAIETGIEAGYISESATNLDGTVMAFLTNEGELYVVSKKKASLVSEDVLGFTLSIEGSGIGYVSGSALECSLNLYDVSKKKSSTVMEDCIATTIAYYGYELSPDGKSMAYYEFDDEEFEATLMYFNGSKSTKITSSDVELLGLSDGGKYIYVIGDNDGDDALYTYNKKGDREKIGACTSSTVSFNADHTQILYMNDGKTYASVKGKEGFKLSSAKASLICSSDSSSLSQNGNTTYPVSSLFNHVYSVYSDGKYNIWNLKKNSDKSIKLVSNVSDWTMDADCKYVYYVNNDDELCVLKISHGDNASDKAKVLAEDVDNYVVTSNRKKLYYIADNALYSCNGKNGKSKKTVASDDVSSYYLVLNAKDVVYYIMDGDCYACSNGRKGKKVLTEAEGLIGFPNGVVYSATEDTLYVSTGAKKLSKLHTIAD